MKTVDYKRFKKLVDRLAKEVPTEVTLWNPVSGEYKFKGIWSEILTRMEIDRIMYGESEIRNKGT
jgi:hypothetical protein